MAEIFNDDVTIQGDEDTTQLEVRGHTTQTASLQTWADSAGDALVQVTGDGRLQVGQMGTETPDALIEAHREDNPLLPQRGIHTLGQVGGEITDGVAWAVHELELLGSGGVEGVHSALRAQLSQQNSGDATTANVRAGEFTAINFGGSTTDPVGRAAGLQVEVTNAQNAHLAEAVGVQIAMQQEDGGSGVVDTAYGLRVEDIAAGTENYAIQTGKGLVHLGDTVELQRPAGVPGTPDTDTLRLYPKSDGKLYAKNWNGTEYDLTESGSGSVNSVGLVMPSEFSVSGSPVTSSGDLTVSKTNQSSNTVFAGPSNGAAAAPSFRALQAADLPAHTHSASNISDFDTEVSNNTEVAANTAARHSPNADIKLNEGGANEVAAAELRAHMDDASKHRQINDSGTSATELWSASKINTQLIGKAANTHTHAAGDIISGMLPIAIGGTGAANAADARTNLGLGALATKSNIDTADIANNAVTLAKLADGTPDKLLGFDANGEPSELGLPSWSALIPRTVLGSDVANLTLSSIEQNFNYLRLVLEFRTKRNLQYDALRLEFSGLGGTNYDWMNVRFYHTGAIYDGARNSAYIRTNDRSASGNTATSGYYGFIDIIIARYAVASALKIVRGMMSLDSTLSTEVNQMTTGFFSGFFKNTSNAVTSIKITADSGANIASGSAYALYGGY